MKYNFNYLNTICGGIEVSICVFMICVFMLNKKELQQKNFLYGINTLSFAPFYSYVFTGCALPLHSGVYVSGHFNDLATPPISLHREANPVNTSFYSSVWCHVDRFCSSEFRYRRLHHHIFSPRRYEPWHRRVTQYFRICEWRWSSQRDINTNINWTYI